MPAMKMFAQASERVQRQLQENARVVRQLARALQDRRFRLVLTCTRGSSDHAALFAKQLIETRLRIPVASFAPSIASLYGADLHLSGALSQQSCKLP
jgi:glutamine---fructose-6-phosphate transaminase (isomerizing)